MSFIALHNEKNIALNTDQLVYGRDEMLSLKSAMETSEKLSRLLEQEESRISHAEEKGFAIGLQKGEREGRQQADNVLASKLIELNLLQQQNSQKMRESVVTLATQLVRKIASEVGAPEMVAAIAKKAVDEMVESDYLILSVHPSVVDEVTTRLSTFYQIVNCANLPGDPQGFIGQRNQGPSIDVRGDEGFQRYDCHIETALGKTIASLSVQLECLETLIQQRLVKQNTNNSDLNTNPQ